MDIKKIVLVILLLGLVYLAIQSIRTGKVLRRNWWMKPIDRNENPVLFWLRIVLWIVCGILIIRMLWR